MSKTIGVALNLKDMFSPALKSAMKTSKLMTDQVKSTNGVFSQMGKTSLFANMNKEGKEATKRLAEMGTKIHETMSLAKKAVIGLGVAMGGLIFKVGIEGLKELEDASAKVKSIAQDALNLQVIKDGLLKASNKTGINTKELGDTQYNAISSGVKANESLQAALTSAKLAKAGFTDANSALKVLTSTMNVYGLQGQEAMGKISDKMLVVQNLGVTTVAELAESMGSVTPIAQSAGVSIDDLDASMISLTKNGIKTDEAVTELKGIFTSVIAPTKESSDAAKKFGIDFSAAALKSKGFSKFLEEIREKTGGSTEKMGQLFGNVRALTGALVLTGSGFNDFNNGLEAVRDSAGMTDKAFDIINNTIGNKWNKLKNTFKNTATSILDTQSGALGKLADNVTNWFTNNESNMQVWVDKIGGIITQVVEKIKGIVDFIKSNKEVIVTIGEIVLAFMAVVKVMLLVDKAFKAWQTTMEMINLLFIDTPIGWIIIIIGLLVIAGVLLYKNWDKIKAKAKELWDAIKNTFEWIGNSIKEAWNGAIDATVNFFTWIWNSITDFGSWVINGIGSFFSWVWNSIKGFLKWVVDGVSNFFTWLIAAIPKFIDSVINWIKDIPNKIAYILGFILGKFTKWSAELSLWIAIEVPKIVKAIIDWFKELPNKIWDWLLATWNKFRQWAIDLTVWASTEISNFIEFLISWFAQLPGRIWDWLVATWDRFVDWGANLLDWAGTTMSNFIDSIIDWISKLPGRIWDWLVEAANKVSDWGADLIKRGTDAAVGLGNSIVGAVSEIPSKMWDIGKNIVEGLWNGISGMAGWLKDKASDFVDSFVQGFKDGLGIHSPSRLFADEVGKFIPMGIEVGFNTEFPNTLNNMKSKTQTLAESTKPNNNSIGTNSKSSSSPIIYINNQFTIQGNLIGNEEFMDQTGQHIWNTIETNINNI